MLANQKAMKYEEEARKIPDVPVNTPESPQGHQAPQQPVLLQQQHQQPPLATTANGTAAVASAVPIPATAPGPPNGIVCLLLFIIIGHF